MQCPSDFTDDNRNYLVTSFTIIRSTARIFCTKNYITLEFYQVSTGLQTTILVTVGVKIQLET